MFRLSATRCTASALTNVNMDVVYWHAGPWDVRVLPFVHPQSRHSLRLPPVLRTYGTIVHNVFGLRSADPAQPLGICYFITPTTAPHIEEDDNAAGDAVPLDPQPMHHTGPRRRQHHHQHRSTSISKRPGSTRSASRISIETSSSGVSSRSNTRQPLSRPALNPRHLLLLLVWNA